MLVHHHPLENSNKWFSFPADARARAFITPGIARIRVIADPESVTQIFQATSYFALNDGSYKSLPLGTPVLSALHLRQADGSLLEITRGSLLNFRNKAFARIASLGEPYWCSYAKEETIPINGPCPLTENFLMSYITLTFLELDQLDEHMRSKAQLLMPVKVKFN